MKLAEALILRADLKKRIKQLRERLMRNAKVQEGDQPAEQPGELMTEFDRVAADLEWVIRRINWTNANLMFDNDHRISDAIAMRATLDLRILTIMAVIDAAFERELKFVATIDIAAWQKQLDDLSRQRRDLDTQLQSINWQLDLLEP